MLLCLSEGVGCVGVVYLILCVTSLNVLLNSFFKRSNPYAFDDRTIYREVCYFFCLCVFAVCLSPTALGMESGAIPNSGIKASSYSTTSNGLSRVPQHARFGQDNYWSNDQVDSQPWIQVDFGSSRNVTGLQTEGHSGSKYGYFVMDINVKVGMLETELAFIKNESGVTKVGCFIASLCSEHFFLFWPRLMVQKQYIYWDKNN